MVTAYSLERYLPLYSVSENGIVLKNSSNPIPIINNNAPIVEVTNENPETGDDDWIGKQVERGNAGEEAAHEYLAGIFGEENTKRVPLRSAKKGYDIEVIDEDDIRGFEVKTTVGSNSFHITSNELKVASKMLENYNLFFIRVDCRTKRVTGYIINNPALNLGLDYNALTAKVCYDKVTLVPDQFVISFVEGYLQNLSSIDLSRSKSFEAIFNQMEFGV